MRGSTGDQGVIHDALCADQQVTRASFMTPYARING